MPALVEALTSHGMHPDRALEVAMAELGPPHELADAARRVGRRWPHRAPALAFALLPLLAYLGVAVALVPGLLDGAIGLSRLERVQDWLGPMIHVNALTQAIVFTWWLDRRARGFPGAQPYALAGAVAIAAVCGLLHASVVEAGSIRALRLMFEPNVGTWRTVAVLLTTWWMTRRASTAN